MADVQRPELDPPPRHFAHARKRILFAGVMMAAIAVALVWAATPALAALGVRSPGTATNAPAPRPTPTVRTRCPISSASVGAATACSPCPSAGLEPNNGPSCPPCPPQTEGPSSSVSCSSCPPGTAVACTPCAESARPCPVLQPTASPIPRAGVPVIFFCPPVPVPMQEAPGTVVLRGEICGSGFHPAELITLTATGPHASISWQVHANSAGNIIAPISPLICHLVPVTISAVGNQNSHSNMLLLASDACALGA